MRRRPPMPVLALSLSTTAACAETKPARPFALALVESAAGEQAIAPLALIR